MYLSVLESSFKKNLFAISARLQPMPGQTFRHLPHLSPRHDSLFKTGLFSPFLHSIRMEWVGQTSSQMPQPVHKSFFIVTDMLFCIYLRIKSYKDLFWSHACTYRFYRIKMCLIHYHTFGSISNFIFYINNYI